MSQHRPVRYDNGLPREMRTGEIVEPEYLGTNTPNSEKILFGDGTWRTPYYSKQTTTTSNATTTTIETIPIAIDTGVLIRTFVISRKTSGAGVGTSGSVNAYVRTVKAKNVGGTVTIGSISSDFTSEDIAAFEATFDVNGTNVRVRVSGALNDNVSWVATTYIYNI